MMNKKELALIFEKLDKEQNFSGAVLVSQDGEVVFEKAHGFASRQLNVPNVLETKFHIASVTKMFIAMAALILSSTAPPMEIKRTGSGCMNALNLSVIQ